MLKIATKNGISKKLYRSRISQGWCESRAATTPVRNYRGEYAVYRNDEIVAMGTAKECAEELGVSADYIRWMTTPTGKKRLANRKNPNRATAAVKLDCDYNL